MKQKCSTFLQKNKSSVEKLNMNNTIYNVFWLLTLTASHTPDRAFFSLFFIVLRILHSKNGYISHPAAFIRPSMS